MADNVEPKKWQSLSKAVTICAAGMVLGFGTCGLGFLFKTAGVIRPMAIIGSLVFFGSLLGFVVIGLIALCRVMLDVFRR